MNFQSQQIKSRQEIRHYLRDYPSLTLKDRPSLNTRFEEILTLTDLGESVFGGILMSFKKIKPIKEKS